MTSPVGPLNSLIELVISMTEGGKAEVPNTLPGKMETRVENGYVKGGCPFSQMSHSKSSPTLGE